MFESVDIRIDRRMMARKKKPLFSFVKDFVLVLVIVRKGQIRKQGKGR